MTKRKKTEFYLLRSKKLSEGDLFITDYLKTKQRLERLEQDFEILKNLFKTKKFILKMKKKIKEHVCVSCGLEIGCAVNNGDSVFSSLRPPFSLSPKQKRELKKWKI